MRSGTVNAVLAAAAGWLDATAYLRGHVFVANMTGNTVLFGLGLGHQPPGKLRARSAPLRSKPLP